MVRPPTLWTLSWGQETLRELRGSSQVETKGRNTNNPMSFRGRFILGRTSEDGWEKNRRTYWNFQRNEWRDFRRRPRGTGGLI